MNILFRLHSDAKFINLLNLSHEQLKHAFLRKRIEISTGRECDPSKWNNKSGRAAGTKEGLKSFNAFLDDLQFKVFEAHRSLLEKGKQITAEGVKNVLLGRGEKPYMLIEIFKDHNQKVAALLGREFASETLARYENTTKKAWEIQTSRP